jgi:hypothetical protein
MPDDKPKLPLTTLLIVGQIAVMIVGFGGMIYAIGGKVAELESSRRDLGKLADTVADLAKAQASSAVIDALHTKSLEEIQRRLDLIERRTHEGNLK